MEEKKAVELAIKFAEQKGYDTRQYNVTAKKTYNDWEIYFYRKMIYKPRPGDFFTVCIDDMSKSVRRIIKGK